MRRSQFHLVICVIMKSKVRIKRSRPPEKVIAENIEIKKTEKERERIKGNEINPLNFGRVSAENKDRRKIKEIFGPKITTSYNGIVYCFSC